MCLLAVAPFLRTISNLISNLIFSLQTALELSAFLKKIKSSRVDELHKALDTKFTISTAFKTPDELAKLREWALTNDKGSTGSNNAEAAVPAENEAELGTAEA